MITIGGFDVDAAITEEHAFDADVTDYAVEKGSNISDNIRSRPAKVTIEGVVSDTPLTEMARTRAASGGSGPPSQDALAHLEKIRDDREPVTIVTSLRLYENMALESLSIPRSKDTGDALRFRAVFKQIRFVTNARTTVRVATPKSRKKVNRGSKPSGTVADPTSIKSPVGTRKSGLTQIKEYASGLF